MNLFDEGYKRKLIEDIISLEFPPFLNPPPGLGSFLGFTTAREQKVRLLELQKMSIEELNEAYALAKLDTEDTDIHSKQDTSIFLSASRQAESPVKILDQWTLGSEDYTHWGMLDYWTIDEFLSLSFNLDPKQSTPINIKKYLTRLPQTFIHELQNRKELCTRAQTNHIIQTKMRPIKFIEWASIKKIHLPHAIREHINSEIKLNKKDETQNIAERPITTRERETMLKIIIGMAIKGYGYNPKSSRNAATTEIAHDLSQLGIPVSDDTVRKFINEAKDLIVTAEP